MDHCVTANCLLTAYLCFSDEIFVCLIVWAIPKKRVISNYLAFCSCVPQELECLQDHLEDLIVECREIVGNLTELESEVGKSQHCSIRA